MATTSRGYRYPASTDDVRPYEDVQFLASDVDADMATVLTTFGTEDAVRVATVGAFALTATDPSELTKLRTVGIGVVAGRLYRFHGQMMYSAVTDAWAVEIRKTTTAGTLCGGFRLAVSAGSTVAWDILWPCTLTETVQFFYVANRLSGSGTLTAFGVNDGFNNTYSAVDRAGAASVMRDVA